MRKPKRRACRREPPAFLVPFGLGLLLAMCGSVRLALFVAALALIYVGFSKT